MYVNKGASNL